MKRLKSTGGPNTGHDKALPERSLWVSVLEHAFNTSCFKRPNQDRERKYIERKPTDKQFNGRETRIAEFETEAELCRKWISDCGRDFIWVCSMAGMDADWLSEKFRAGKFDHKRFKSEVRNG